MDEDLDQAVDWLLRVRQLQGEPWNMSLTEALQEAQAEIMLGTKLTVPIEDCTDCDGPCYTTED